MIKYCTLGVQIPSFIKIRTKDVVTVTFQKIPDFPRFLAPKPPFLDKIEIFWSFRKDLVTARRMVFFFASQSVQ